MNRRVSGLGACLALTAAVLAGCGGDSGSSEASTTEFCDLASEVDDARAKLDDFFAGDASDAKDIESDFEGLADSAKAALKEAPSEIKKDITAFIKAFGELQKVAEDNVFNYSDLASDADFQAIESDLSGPAERIDAFVVDTCGTEESDASSDSGSSDDADSSEDSGNSSANFCDLAKQAGASGEAVAQLLAGFVLDPDEVRDAIGEYVDDAKAARDEAPDEIKDDLDDSVAAFEDLLTIAEDNDFDFPDIASDPRFDDVSSEFDSASNQIARGLADECGITSTDDFFYTDSDSGSGSDSGSVEDQQVRIIRSIFPRLSEDDARCLIEGGLDPSGTSTANYLEILNDCGLELSDLQPDG